MSELEAKLQQQEAELIHERDSAIELRQRVEDQKKIQDSVTRVESQVQTLLEKSTNSDTCGRDQREITDQLSSKYAFVCHSRCMLTSRIGSISSLSILTRSKTMQ